MGNSSAVQQQTSTEDAVDSAAPASSPAATATVSDFDAEMEARLHAFEKLERDLSESLKPQSKWGDETFRAEPTGEADDDKEYHEVCVPDEDEFMDGGPLLPIVAKFLRKRYPARDSPFSRPMTSEDAEFLTSNLRNFKIVTTHRPEFKRGYRIYGIDPRSAGAIAIGADEKEVNEKGGQTVKDYFTERYEVDIKDEHAPCVAVKKLQGWTYLPIQFCEVLPGQRLCTPSYELPDPKDTSRVPDFTPAEPEEGDGDGGTEFKKKNKKKKKNKNKESEAGDNSSVSTAPVCGEPVAAPVAAAASVAPAAEVVPKVEKEHSLYRKREPQRFGVPEATWNHRKSLGVCLRCGHPSHRIHDCMLYGIDDGSKDWHDVPRYVLMNMEIPTKPKQTLAQKCNVPKSDWYRRRDGGLCERCAHPGHIIQECRLMKIDEMWNDGTKRWIDVPEYLEDSTPNKIPGKDPVPKGFVWDHDRYYQLGEDGVTKIPLIKKVYTPNKKDMRPVQDLPAVPWEEAEKLEKEQRAGKDGVSVGESKTGAQDATAKDWKPKRDAESAAVTRAEPIVDAEGYTILDKAGTLKKKVLKKGAGPLMKPQTILQVHYIGWIVSAPDFKEEEPKEFHNTYAIDDPLEFVHGEGQELPVWEETIPTMQTGEKCEIICGPEYGFDAKGYDDIVPPNATLKFHLEILFAKPPEDPIEIRLADAQELKDRGNTHFKSGAFLLAQTAYEEALARLSHTWGMSLSQDVEITKFRATVNANLSLAYLRTKDCDKAITAADDGLVHNQHSAKLWYRKAQALRGLERWDEAVKAGNMAEEYDPDDSSIRAFNKSLPGAREEAKRREKRMYEQMFSSDKNTPSPSPSTPISADNNATADAAPEAALDGAA